VRRQFGAAECDITLAPAATTNTPGPSLTIGAN
jgi:hypothetical protein